MQEMGLKTTFRWRGGQYPAGVTSSPRTPSERAVSTRWWLLNSVSATVMQGLTPVHFSAQPEPYLTRNTPFPPPNNPRHLPNTRKQTPKQSLNAPPIPQKALTLSRKVDECKPLPSWLTGPATAPPRTMSPRACPPPVTRVVEEKRSNRDRTCPHDLP